MKKLIIIIAIIITTLQLASFIANEVDVNMLTSFKTYDLTKINENYLGQTGYDYEKAGQEYNKN